MRPVDRESSTAAPWRAVRVTTRSHTARRHGLAIKYVRDPASAEDGQRILIDRLWPRGVSKERAALSEWRRDLAPSTELRQWFGHVPERWEEFRKRYAHELDANPEAVAELRKWLRQGRVTLVYGARDEERNQAVALRHYLLS